MSDKWNISKFSRLFVQTGGLVIDLHSQLQAPHPASSRATNSLSPEDPKFAARMTQRLAQQPDTGVTQGIVGQIELCQRLVDPQGRRKILTSSGSEATAVQPVKDKQ